MVDTSDRVGEQRGHVPGQGQQIIGLLFPGHLIDAGGAVQ